MSICEAAESKAVELGRTLNKTTRQQLSQYNDDEQVGWVANPFMEWIMQRVNNQVMARSAQPSKTSNNTIINKPKVIEKPVIIEKPVEKPADDDDMEIGSSLFD